MDDLNALASGAAAWAKARIRPHVEALDLAPLAPPPVPLQEAIAELGLLSAPEGSAVGTGAAVRILRAIAEECAGVAAYAAHALAGEEAARRSGLDPAGRLWALALTDAEELFPTRLDSEGRGLVPRRREVELVGGKLQGEMRSVPLAPVAQGIGVLCSSEGKPSLAWVETGSRVRLGAALGRLGLRACPTADVTFEDAPVLSAAPLAPPALLGLVARSSLYLGACACGAAEAALAAARRYAGERHQGGHAIVGHEPVRLLLVRNEAPVSAVRTALSAAADQEEGPEAVRRALRAKLAVNAATVQAALDSVQVLGGYGYMRDFGQEKRLRDVVTLSLLPLDEARLALLSDSGDSAL